MIKTMISIFKKPLFPMSKFTLLLFIILAASATLVNSTKQPRFRASSMYFPQRNRPVQPSGPNPCSFIPGSGHCKPPKWCTLHIVHQHMGSYWLWKWKLRARMYGCFFCPRVFFLLLTIACGLVSKCNLPYHGVLKTVQVFHCLYFHDHEFNFLIVIWGMLLVLGFLPVNKRVANF